MCLESSLDDEEVRGLACGGRVTGLCNVVELLCNVTLYMSLCLHVLSYVSVLEVSIPRVIVSIKAVCTVFLSVWY